MIELRDRARFAVEAIAELRIGGKLFGKDLDGDGAIEPRVARPIDFTHPAGPERGADLIGTEANA